MVKDTLIKENKFTPRMTYKQLYEYFGQEFTQYRFFKVLSRFRSAASFQSVTLGTDFQVYDLLKVFLLFGNKSPFDTIRSFISTDSNLDLICPIGRSIYDNIETVSDKLEESQWIVILDDTEYGFVLLRKKNNNIIKNYFFPVRTSEQNRFFFHEYDIQQNKLNMIGETFDDVLTFYSLDLEHGFQPKQFVDRCANIQLDLNFSSNKSEINKATGSFLDENPPFFYFGEEDF